MNAELATKRDETGDLQQRLVHDIERLPGVLAADIWLSGPLHLRALHVTASPRASGLIIANAAAQVLRRNGLDKMSIGLGCLIREPAHGFACQLHGLDILPHEACNPAPPGDRERAERIPGRRSLEETRGSTDFEFLVSIQSLLESVGRVA